mmetsp:Transcript_121972/g.379687  ORF Transcript_121972/g.379687 Transcript_121972/m.379687 type:complete len:321 (+) Transcript_121972:791-1753(+)
MLATSTLWLMGGGPAGPFITLAVVSRESLKSAFWTPRCSIRLLEATSLSRISLIFSRLPFVSFSMRSLSGLPTAMLSICSRQASISLYRPRPSRALALRYQALWSWSSILMAISAAFRASLKHPSLIAACARFFSRAMWISPSCLVATLSVAGALILQRASWPWRQLVSASLWLPFSHSRTPSFLHFSPKSIRWTSSSGSFKVSPPWSFSRLSALFCSSNACWRFLDSQERKSSSAPFSPSRSILSRNWQSDRKLSSRSRSWGNGKSCSSASLNVCIRKTSTILYFRMGCTRRFVSGLQSSSSSMTSSRFSFDSLTFSNC